MAISYKNLFITRTLFSTIAYKIIAILLLGYWDVLARFWLEVIARLLVSYC